MIPGKSPSCGDGVQQFPELCPKDAGNESPTVNVRAVQPRRYREGESTETKHLQPPFHETLEKEQRLYKVQRK